MPRWLPGWCLPKSPVSAGVNSRCPARTARRSAALLALAADASCAVRCRRPRSRPASTCRPMRGGRGETTEESLRAFAKSIEIGVSTLEFDIDITKDEQPVVWHDPMISPTRVLRHRARLPRRPGVSLRGQSWCTSSPSRRSAPWTAASPLVSSPRRSRAGQQDSDSCRKSSRSPTRIALTSATTSKPRWRPTIPGASADPQEFVDVILAAVRSAGQVDRVEIQSFDWRTLPHGASGRAVDSLGGVVERARPGCRARRGWPVSTPRVVGDPMIGAMMVGASMLSPRYQLVDKAFVDRAHALGLKVIPWTVDDAGAMRAADRRRRRRHHHRLSDAGCEALWPSWVCRCHRLLILLINRQLQHAEVE